MSIGAFLPIIGKVMDLVFPDPSKAAEAKLRAAELAQKGELAFLDADVKLAVGQMEINKEEAKSTNWFVAGWRPFVGWVGGAGLAYAAVLEPLMRFAAKIGGYAGDFPVLDTTITLQVLLGLLGLGAYRTFEKTKGVARG